MLGRGGGGGGGGARLFDCASPKAQPINTDIGSAPIMEVYKNKKRRGGHSTTLVLIFTAAGYRNLKKQLKHMPSQQKKTF